MDENGTNGRSPRRGKSPGRQEAAKRTNALLRQRREQGDLWPGGRRPSHGVRMLEGLIARGDGLPGTLGQLLIEKETAYLADLGGAEQVSNMEAGLVRRLAEGDLLIALIRGQTIGPHGEPKRLPWARLRDVATLHARLADSYKGITQALGLHRREREIDPFRAEEIRQLAAAPPTAPSQDGDG